MSPAPYDLQTLQDALLFICMEAVEKTAGVRFVPFAAVVESDGMIGVVAEPLNDPALMNDHLKKLLLTLKTHAEARPLLAAAFCMVVSAVPPGLSEKVEAVMVQMEAPSGETRCFLVPVSKDGDGKLRKGKPFTLDQKPLVFLAPSSA